MMKKITLSRLLKVVKRKFTESSLCSKWLSIETLTWIESKAGIVELVETIIDM